MKGTNDFPYSYILSLASVPFEYQYIHSKSFYEKSPLAAYNDLVLYRTLNSVVNSRDGFRENDPSNVPLQFQYEAADCRIYYTPEMAVDQTAAWKTVADAAWGGVQRCVAGSLGGTEEAPGYGGKMKKRGLEGKHRVRRGMDMGEHFKAMKETWTGRDSIVPGGDGYMTL